MMYEKLLQPQCRMTWRSEDDQRVRGGEIFEEGSDTQKMTYHSPLLVLRPSRCVFWPAAAEAKLEGRFDGMLKYENVLALLEFKEG
jgi:hypothetical protein